MAKSLTVDFLLKKPRFVVLTIIFLYQKTLSPDHGLLKKSFPNGFCRYWPSCSTYSYQAVQKYGIFVGLFHSVGRIMRCNPWGRGGIDEVK